MTTPFEDDIAAIAGIDAVPTILDVVCRTTGMGFAAVARVTEERWIACSVRDEIGFGLTPGGELAARTTLCDEIRASRQPIVIDHVAEDPVYGAHHTPARYGFQSYISMPILRKDGSFFGTLCAIDPKPLLVNNPETIGMFKLFADLIAFHLDTRERLQRSEAALEGERRSTELREEFIAVMGHDLRNPLSAISMGAEILRNKAPLEGRFLALLDRMQNSVDRMAALIDNVLDFARGRLGGGLPIERTPQPIGPLLEQVIGELRTSWPDRLVTAHLDLEHEVSCDAGRIAQLASNLLSNALTHGAASAPVRVTATTTADMFELTVANAGEPIPPAVIKHLFHPFFRATAKPDQQGLGLGLYIASEIAHAHGGTLEVHSTAEETAFTFRMTRG